jgi:hypothetical protein
MSAAVHSLRFHHIHLVRRRHIHHVLGTLRRCFLGTLHHILQVLRYCRIQAQAKEISLAVHTAPEKATAARRRVGLRTVGLGLGRRLVSWPRARRSRRLGLPWRCDVAMKCYRALSVDMRRLRGAKRGFAGRVLG